MLGGMGQMPCPKFSCCVSTIVSSKSLKLVWSLTDLENLTGSILAVEQYRQLTSDMDSVYYTGSWAASLSHFH